MPDALRVAADPSGVPDRVVVAMLQPALQGQVRLDDYQRSVLGQWTVEGRQLVQLTPLEESHVAVLPFGLEAVAEYPALWDRARQLGEQARRQGRLMLVFCHGDRDLAAPSDNCVMLRTSTRRSRLAPRDVPLPAWVEDPERQLGKIRPRSFAQVPRVGFMGQAHPLGLDGVAPPARFLKWAKWAVRCTGTRLDLDALLGVPAAYPERVASLVSLRSSRQVEAQVVLRPAMTRLDLNRVEDRASHRAYLAALADADYGLAVSGLGNYSYRMYENFAAGRPVVLVDTDVALPCAGHPSWPAVLIRVQPRELPRLGRVVARAHHQSGAAGYQQAQQQARRLWDEALSAAAFLRRLVETCREHPDLDAAGLAARLR